MIRRPPISTRTDTLFPYTTLFRSIRDGRVVVGSVINCRTCLKEFEKVGIHQIYCSPKCRQKRWSSDPQWTINRRMSAGVKSSLGDGKNGRSWETLVGY